MKDQKNYKPKNGIDESIFLLKEDGTLAPYHKASIDAFLALGWIELAVANKVFEVSIELKNAYGVNVMAQSQHEANTIIQGMIYDNEISSSQQPRMDGNYDVSFISLKGSDISLI